LAVFFFHPYPFAIIRASLVELLLLQILCES
jgi:hypothetical protein